VLRDVSPFFDPEGDYLYFLSYREFDPVYDSLQFDLGFPRGCRPYLVTLRKDVPPPFGPERARRLRRQRRSNDDDDEVTETEIHFEGIEERVVAFPIPDGRFKQIAATSERVFFTRLPIEGSLRGERSQGESRSRAILEFFDLESEKLESVVSQISSFRLSQDGEHVICRSGQGLRVFRSRERPAKDEGRSGGWIDLDRVQVPVVPETEWRQMYREAWRLQRDHFWSEDMGNVDWSAVFDRYLPLLDRVSCRSEVSDLLWEMHGELGTSHAYESGGDYRLEPNYGIGFLGAKTEFDEGENAYRLVRVMRGDIWDERASSPLARPGVELKEGDFIIAIDGQRLSRDLRPEQCLVHRMGRDVSLTFRRAGEKETHPRSIRALRSEQRLRYREWVERNRRYVHETSHGRVGYIHIPNMGPSGFAEFHRAFLQELDRSGLVIDVRFNGGGHVSQLILEKLARRRIGYSKSRWFGATPYPEESPAGPMVAITNEYAGSDGDIFSHAFKLMKMGPLIGKRTWGGVIGINPSHSLVDGGVTTQPEYSFWFEDVGWRVENYGTEPDLEIEISPADYAAGRDPQLEAALSSCLDGIRRWSPKKPRFEPGLDHLPQLEPGF
jgi:tricorn protease